MKKHLRKLVLVLPILVVFLIGCEPDGLEEHESSPMSLNKFSDTLTIGVISDRVQDEVLIHQQMISYMQKEFNQELRIGFNVIVVRSVDEMVRQVNDGNVDLLFDSAFPIKITVEKTNLELFMKQWKAGVEKYRTVFFTRSESDINSLEDLKGKIVGFEKPYSTSGFYLPQKELNESGLKTKKVATLKESVPPNIVGYYFTADDENTIFWVLEKKLLVGVTDNISFEQYSGPRVDELKLIHETVDIPRYLLAINKGLDQRIKNRLRNVLINMDDTQEGRDVLMGFYGTTRFDTLSSQDKQLLENF